MRIRIAAVGVIVAALALTGCGGGDSSSSSAPAASAVASSGQPDASSPAADPSTAAPVDVPTGPLTADQIANAIGQTVPSVQKVTVIDESNDPNELLGRPNGYTSAAILHDARVSAGTDLGVSLGATVEVFETPELATARAEYVTRVSASISDQQYVVADSYAVLRGSEDLTPSQFTEYEDAFHAVLAGTIAAPVPGTGLVKDQPAEGTPQDMAITEQAFTVQDFGNDIYVQYAFVITNPNPATLGEFPTVRVTARGKSGEVLGTDEAVLMELGPQQTTAWASQLDAADIPATVDFEYVKADWVNREQSPADFSAWPVTGLGVTRDGSSYAIAGEVTNPTTEDEDNVRVTVVLRNAAGTMVGAAQTYVTGVGAGQKTPFSTDFGWASGKVADAQGYAEPW